MKGPTVILLVALAGFTGVAVAFSLGLPPICGIALFAFCVAMMFMAWDRVTSAIGGTGKAEGGKAGEGGGEEVLDALVVDDDPASGGASPPREQMVDLYRTVLGLDTHRAGALYDAGYARLEDLEGVSVEQLIKVESISPTQARKMAARVALIFRDGPGG